MGLRDFLRRFRLESVQAGEGKRGIDNVDATAGAGQSHRGASGPVTFPPNYVPPVDEGRPPH